LQLASRIARESCPPAIYNCGVSLAPLEDDDAFRQRLRDELVALVDRVLGDDGVEDELAEDEIADVIPAREIVNRFVKEHGLEREKIAKQARIDPSALRGLCRGERKCGDDALARLAKVLGCNP